METLITRTKSKRNFELLKKLAIQLGESVEIPSTERAEDLAFSEMMQQAKTGINVSRETIIEALNVKLSDA